jgi:hypothetical protein
MAEEYDAKAANLRDKTTHFSPRAK